VVLGLTYLLLTVLVSTVPNSFISQALVVFIMVKTIGMMLESGSWKNPE
jgi:hypothetical protein